MKNNLLVSLINYYTFLINNSQSLTELKLLTSKDVIVKNLSIFNAIRVLMLDCKYNESLKMLDDSFKDSRAEFINELRLFINTFVNGGEHYHEYIHTQNNVQFEDNIFKEIRILHEEVSSIENNFLNLENTIKNEMQKIVIENSQILPESNDINQRKMLVDLVQTEVQVIAKETQKFIIQYTSMLERLEKHTTTSFDKFSKLCENTLEKKDQAVNHDLNLISKRIIIVGFVVAMITAPIVGSITGYITAHINKDTFFNALNTIVQSKNKQ